MSTTFHEHGWECNFIIYLSNSSKVDYANTIIFNHVHSNNKSRIIFLLVIHICSKNTLDANLMYLVIQLSQQATGISTLLLFLLDFHDKGNRLSFQNETPIFNINLSKAKISTNLTLGVLGSQEFPVQFAKLRVSSISTNSVYYLTIRGKNVLCSPVRQQLQIMLTILLFMLPNILEII